MKHLCRILPALALCLAPGAWAQLPAIPDGGRFLAEDDSLGYEEFRNLSAKAQKRAREKAEDWIDQSLETLRLDQSEAALDRALDCAATAVGYCPYMARAWTRYAEVATGLRKYDTAVACIVHARNALRYQLDEEARMRSLIELERVSAVADYNVQEFDTALESALFVIDETADQWETRLLAARCLIYFDRSAEAGRLIAMFPLDSPGYENMLAMRGTIALEQGDFEAADRAFEQAAQRGLRDPVFENDRGRLYLEISEYPRAIDHFRRAMELAPRFREAAGNLGVAQKRLGDLAAAETTLTTLLSSAPRYAPAHFNLAEVYRERAKGSSGEARADLARRSWAEYNLALQYGTPSDLVIPRRATLRTYASDLDLVGPDLFTLAADSTISVHALTVLARAEKDQGRLDIAEQVLDLVTQREDATALAFAELGEVRLRRGRFRGAREALERACALDSSLVVARVNLSIAYDELGDRTAAWATLDEAIEIDPTHPLVLRRIEDQTRRRHR